MSGERQGVVCVCVSIIISKYTHLRLMGWVLLKVSSCFMKREFFPCHHHLSLGVQALGSVKCLETITIFSGANSIELNFNIDSI